MSTLKPATMALYHPRLAFGEQQDAPLTVGAEEELLLVSRSRCLPEPVAGRLMELLAPDRRFALELRSGQIETSSSAMMTAQDVGRELASARDVLASAAPALAVPIAVPVHPTSPSPTPLTPRERYTSIAQSAPWAARELETCGMHVHVGVSGAERALAVTNALRSYLPLLASLASNSPFHHGRDARVASTRARLNRTLPRHGVPPAFPTWEEYERYLRWGSSTGVIPDSSYHWYDLRLNVVHGTIELRVFDVQTEIADAETLIALSHALVASLVQRFDAGDSLPIHESHLIEESLRLVERDGTSGCVVDLDAGELVHTREALSRLAESLDPVARTIGCDDLPDRVDTLSTLTGSDRQRLIASGRGMNGLLRWLTDRTVSTLPARRHAAP